MKRELNPGTNVKDYEYFNFRLLAGAEIRSVMEDVWGGACVTDSNCVDIISHCDKEAGVTGEVVI